MEGISQAPTNAPRKEEALPPSDSRQAGELIQAAAKALGGTVIAASSRTETKEPSTIIVRIPARSYSPFLERLRQVGHIKESGEEAAQRMAAAAVDHEEFEIQIKLIQLQ